MIRNASRLSQIKLKSKNHLVGVSLRSISNATKIIDSYRDIQQQSQKTHFHSLPESSILKSSIESFKRNYIHVHDKRPQLSTLIDNRDGEKDLSKTRKKNMFQRLWERYSLSGQMKRIDIAERLFRAAEHRAKNQ